MINTINNNIMKHKLNIIYKTFIILLISLIYILFFEMFSRISIALIDKNKNYLTYGFNKDYNFEIVDLSEFKFNLENLDKNNFQSSEIKNIKTKDKEKLIWVFGASLTYGFACGSGSSSWPIELNKLNTNIQISNFGFPSIYSEDSIKILTYELIKNKTNNPDYIFWAHRDEEILASVRGFGRNKNKLNINKINGSHNIDFYLLRIEKTFESNLVSYVIIKHIFKKISKRFNFNAKKNFSENDFLLSSKNFKLNTIDAIEIAKSHGVKKFYIVSPFDDEQFKNKENNKKDFLSFYHKVVKDLSNENFVEFIDLFALTPNDLRQNYKNFFCENKHYTLYGNQVISQIINNKLLIN